MFELDRVSHIFRQFKHIRRVRVPQSVLPCAVDFVEFARGIHLAVGRLCRRDVVGVLQPRCLDTARPVRKALCGVS